MYFSSSHSIAFRRETIVYQSKNACNKWCFENFVFHHTINCCAMNWSIITSNCSCLLHRFQYNQSTEINELHKRGMTETLFWMQYFQDGIDRMQSIAVLVSRWNLCRKLNAGNYDRSDAATAVILTHESLCQL